jgi:hypothetical protein
MRPSSGDEYVICTSGQTVIANDHRRILLQQGIRDSHRGCRVATSTSYDEEAAIIQLSKLVIDLQLFLYAAVKAQNLSVFAEPDRVRKVSAILDSTLNFVTPRERRVRLKVQKN